MKDLKTSCKNMDKNTNMDIEGKWVVICFFIACIAFLLGVYSGVDSQKIDYEERTAEMISCTGYEEDFLKEIGFENKDDCVRLNLALDRTYTDECMEGIESGGLDKESYKNLVSLCVYHSFEKNRIFLDSEYWFYKNKK